MLTASNHSSHLQKHWFPQPQPLKPQRQNHYTQCTQYSTWPQTPPQTHSSHPVIDADPWPGNGHSMAGVYSITQQHTSLTAVCGCYTYGMWVEMCSIRCLFVLLCCIYVFMWGYVQTVATDFLERTIKNLSIQTIQQSLLHICMTKIPKKTGNYSFDLTVLYVSCIFCLCSISMILL